MTKQDVLEEDLDKTIGLLEKLIMLIEKIVIPNGNKKN